MSDVYFVRTHHIYQSYTDFWTLVDLAGYPICMPEDIRPSSANVYIIPTRNGEFPQTGWRKPKARIIEWRFEWDAYPRWQGTEIWSSDSWHAKQHGARYVTLGSDARLAEAGVSERAYDAAFLAYLTNRRSYVRDRVIAQGVKLSPNSAWDEQRAGILNASGAYLNIHQRDDVFTIAPLRLVVAAAYKLGVISEAASDAGEFASLIIQEPYATLIDRVPFWIRQPNTLRRYGEALHQYLCVERTFKSVLEAAL